MSEGGVSRSNFIIYAPSYRDDSGGIIVLHKLCHLLNSIGHSAFIWPNKVGTRHTVIKELRAKLRRKPFFLNPNYNTPLADHADLHRNTIVIYPETVSGNPLKARNVARWLLHKPGFHTGTANYGDNELFFIFDDYCIEPGYPISPENKLFVLSLNEAYHNKDTGERKGSCYMLRKSKSATLIHDLSGSVCVDGLSHEETAEIFRKSEYFYCYDEFTLYSQFAALCGCISIVIPSAFRNRQEWVKAHPISRYGIAYGLNDIPHARQTMGQVREYFDGLEHESISTVRRFAEVSRKHFSVSSP